MKERGWTVKANLPREWIVDCEWVGNGEKALIYLGRYLYRGVLAEKNILACEDGQVTFRYTDNSGATKTRTLAGRRLSLAVAATRLAQRLPPDQRLRLPPRQLQAADPALAPAASGLPAQAEGEARLCAASTVAARSP